MSENQSVSIVNELEKFNERQGQRRQSLDEQREKKHRRGTGRTEPETWLQRATDVHNQTMAARIAALPAALREARAAAIARSL
jgi:hypothetical protein